jgi:hypothetical protein
MAGDWIKMRVDLAEDPAVIAISDEVELDEYAVVGRLHRIWSWASVHSADGRINLSARRPQNVRSDAHINENSGAGVCATRIDRLAQCDGFAAAMEAVGWLEFGETGVVFPNFERHNSKSAKRRASEADRKWRVRNASAERPQNVRNEAPKRREEKRREYKEPVSGFRKVHWWKGLSEPDLVDDSKIDILFGAVVAAGYANDTPEDRQRFAALVFSIRRSKAKKPFGLLTSILEGKVKNDYAPDGPGQTDWRNRAKESDHDGARRALKQLDGIGSAQPAAAPDTQAEARNQAARLAEFQAARSKNGKAAS